MKTKILMLSMTTGLLAIPVDESWAKNDETNQHNRITSGQAVRFDRSQPLPELIRMTRANRANIIQNLKPADYVYPNFTENPTKQNQGDRLTQAENVQSRGVGTPAPAIDMSFDGIGQSDAPGGGLPPDTNGDVGIDHYIQYINTDWAIYDKATGNRIGNVEEGNTFWAGFGGPCQTNNAGDPIVLFDKTANVWVFSQFISAGNPNGSQCFAISDRADMTDPNVTFSRYQFDFVGAFNDYPHIGIWADENGDSNGYYFVTHDFSFATNPPSFLGASFSVVERDAMIAGDPAEFVRFQNVGAAGGSAFGALPAHLEGDVLPAGNTCAPFVHTRADLDAYLMWNLCVDWDDTNNSTLSAATIISSGSPYGAGVNLSPQPAPAPAGSELDSFAGNTMYRASARAYPPESALPIDLVINHTADAGEGISGVKWVNFSVSYGNEGAFNSDIIFADGFDPLSNPLDDFSVNIDDEGLYSPDDNYRWMGAISIDQNRNLGLGYSVSSDSVFPSVRYTGRTPADAAGTMRDEQSCVVGSGVQTFVDGSGRAARWGDYSSMSVDPVDQCTFWLTVEYVATTGGSNWENRICSFTFPDCGDPTFFLETKASKDIDVCLLNGDPDIELDLYALNGFNSQVDLTASSPVPGTFDVNFSNSSVSTFPASVTASFANLDQAGVTSFVVDIDADSISPALNRGLALNLTVSSDLPATATLSMPADNSTGQSVRPVFSWTAAADALSYTVEIATDANFTNIVETGTATDTSYATIGSLSGSTEYFWRVTAVNNCGNGVTSAVFSFTTGEPGACALPAVDNIVFTDDIEGDVSDWSTAGGTGNTWATSGVRVNSGVASFLAVDSPVVTDQFLVSPEIVLPVGQSPLTLSFWNFQNIEANTGTGSEACWDGGILEISVDGGNNFTQIDGSKMLTDPYNGGVISGPSPLSTLDAWCADDIVPASGDQEVVSVVDLDDYAGETVQFRFRLGTDAAAGDEGWYIDDVEVKGCEIP